MFAWIQQGTHDMPVACTWLMIFLTVPVGFPVGLAVGMATSAISANLGIIYQPFWDLVPMWIAMTVAGYFQWFVAMPYLWGKIRGKKSSN